MLKIILVVFLIYILTLTRSSVSESLEVIITDTKLPSPRAHITTGYDGDDTIYLWGGQFGNRPISDILKYSISKQTIEYIGKMPNTAMGSGCWIGNNKFVHIGGYTSSRHNHRDVWNFGTTNPSNWTTVTNLTYDLTWSTTIWDEGDNTYTIGGSRRINKYSSATQTVVNVGELSKAVDLPALVWDRNTASVYILGGYRLNDPLIGILKFDAVNGGVISLNVTLPVPAGYVSAVWNGTEAYIIGGTGSSITPSSIFRFNPTTNKVTSVPVNNLVGGVTQTACIFVKKLNRIYIFGGHGQGRYRDEIMFIDLNPTEIPDMTLPEDTSPSAFVWYIVIGALAAVVIIAMGAFCYSRKYSTPRKFIKNNVEAEVQVTRPQNLQQQHDQLPTAPLQSYFENQNQSELNQNVQLSGPFTPNQNFGSPGKPIISIPDHKPVGMGDFEEQPPPYSSVMKP